MFTYTVNQKKIPRWNAVHFFEDPTTDMSKNRLTLTNVNSIISTPIGNMPVGKNATGNFYNLGGRLESPVYPQMDSATRWTIDGYFYVKSFPATYSCVWGLTPYPNDFGLLVGSNGACHIVVYDVFRTSTAVSTVSLNNWYYFNNSYDGTTLYNFIKPANQINDTPTQTYTGSITLPASNTRFWLGMWDPTGGFNYRLDGYLKDVRISNKFILPSQR